METIVIYRSGLLPSTQTFITGQASAIRKYLVQYVGLMPVNAGIQAVPPPILLSETRGLATKCREIAYKVFGVAPRFFASVRESAPRLIHAHFLMDGVHALPLARRLRIPLIVTLHGHVPTGKGKAITGRSIDGQLYRSQLPALWKYTSRFICVSAFIRDKALSLGFPEEKLLLHYIGIDLNMFKPSQATRDANLVLFVGRLAEKKGCSYLLDAMKLVQAQHPQAHLVVVGDGPLKEALVAQAEVSRIKCTFTGNLPHQAVLTWLSQARVFCSPSVTAADGDAEALGMVFAEAQALGVPVVSSLHGGIPEVVQHGITGLLAPERDVPRLAEYLLRFLEDDLFWESCSKAGILWVRERFDIEVQTAKLEQIYTSCLEKDNK